MIAGRGAIGNVNGNGGEGSGCGIQLGGLGNLICALAGDSNAAEQMIANNLHMIRKLTARLASLEKGCRSIPMQR
jgi:hypothetical protein